MPGKDKTRKLQRCFNKLLEQLPKDVQEKQNISRTLIVMKKLIRSLQSKSPLSKTTEAHLRKLPKRDTHAHQSLSNVCGEPVAERRTSTPISFGDNIMNICLTTQQYVLNSRSDIQQRLETISNMPMEEKIKALTLMGLHLQRIGKLIGTLSSLAGADTLEYLENCLRSRISDLLGISRVTLFLYQPQSGLLCGTDVTGLQITTKPGKGITGCCAATGLSAIVNTITESKQFVPEVDETIVEKTANIFCSPIQKNNALTGVLQLCNKKEGFNHYDEFLMTLVCTQLQVVIQNIVQKQKLREKVAQCDVLLEMSRSVTSKLDVTQVVDSILVTVKELVGADRTSLFHVDHEQKEVYAHINNQKINVSWGSGVVGRVVLTGEAINVTDTAQIQYWNPSVDKQTNYKTRSILAVPVFANDCKESKKVVGVIQMINKQSGNIEDTFTNDDMNLVESFSHFVSISLNNCRLYGNSVRKERVAVKLLDAFKDLSLSSLKLHDLLATMTERARALIKADRGTVFLIDSETKELWSTVVDEIKEIRIPMDKGLVGHVATTGEIINIRDVNQDNRFCSDFDNKYGYNSKNILCVPIFNNSNTVIGVALMINKIGANENMFSKEDEELLCRFTQNASAFIENSRMYEHAKVSEIRANEEIRYRANEEVTAFMNIVTDYSTLLTNASSCTLYLLSNDNKTFLPFNAKEASPISLETIESLQHENISDSLVVISHTTNEKYILYYRLFHRNNNFALLQLEKSSPFDSIGKEVVKEIGRNAMFIFNKAFYLGETKEDGYLLSNELSAIQKVIKSSRIHHITKKKSIYLENILHHLDYLVFGIDSNGRIEESNNLFAEYDLSDVPMQSLPCTEWPSYSDKNNQSLFYDIISCYHRQQGAVRRTMPFQTQSRVRYYEYSIVLLDEDEENNNSGILVIIEDISRLQKVDLSLQTIHSSMQQLCTTKNSETEISLLIKKLKKIFFASSILVFCGSSWDTLRLRYQTDSATRRYIGTYDKSLINKAIETGGLIIKNREGSSDSLSAHPQSYVVSVPLIKESRLFGVLYIDGINLPSITNIDERVIYTFGMIISCYIEYDDKIFSLSHSQSVDEPSRILKEENKMLRKRVAESEKVKASFLMNMSHELRTPLNSIIGTAELLGNSKLNEQQKQFLEYISKGSSLLLQLINDILDYTKVETGEIQIECKPFDLRATLEDTVSKFTEANLERNIEICLDYPPDEPSQLIGDAHRVRQIFFQLLSNACKFSNSDSHVMVQIRRVQGSPAEFRVQKFSNTQEIVYHCKVIDYGVGMPQSALEKLFQPFSQVDGSTTRKYEGTGLGLAICKHLIELMKGELFIHSVPNQGTEVSFQCHFGVQRNSRRLFVQGPDISVLRSKGVVIISKFASRFLLQTMLHYFGMNVFICSEISKFDKIGVENEQAEISFIIVDKDLLQCDTYNVWLNLLGDGKFNGFEKNDDCAEIALCNQTASGGSGEFPRAIFLPIRLQQVISCLIELTIAKENTKTKSIEKEECRNANPLILLVEDNRMNQIVIKKQLKKIGISPDLAENGKIAVEKFKNKFYHLILMDCHMPVMDGYTATKEIRSIEVGHERRTTIVALTADALAGTRDQCLAAGMDDYYTKPLRHKNLKEIFEKYSLL